MRRLLFSLAALCLVSIFGCHHMAGVCDCDLDDNPCLHRAPWANCKPGGGAATPAAPAAAPIPAVKDAPQLGPPRI